FRKANEDTLQVMTDILADLDAAIAKLPVTQGAKGRANKWTATAYKGRVLTYKASVSHAAADWTAARDVLRTVQASGVYALETSFDKVWTGMKDSENGPETIFAYQASVDTDPNGNNSNYGERLNFPHSGSHFGCCGFHQPSFNLINFFQVDAAGLPLAVTSSAWDSPPLDPVPPSSDTSQVWKGQNFRGGIMRAVDPRVDWTVG